MSQVTIYGTLVAKRNTAEGWSSANPTLAQGEFGVELDSKKFKIGDGVTAWNDLEYAHTASFAAACNIAISGDATGSADFDGSSDVNIAVKLNEILDKEYSENFVKFTVGKDGRVSAVTVFTAEEYLKALGITLGNEAGNVPVVGDDGKLNTSIIPSLALMDSYVVDSEEAMLALDCQKGDIAIRSDVVKTYILAGEDPTDINNWVQFLSPECNVQSVNGHVGVVVLTTDDVTEGNGNLYYTDDRVYAAIQKFFNENTVVIDGNGNAD